MNKKEGQKIVPVKVGILDAHDRLMEVKKQGFSISECCQDLINKQPFGLTPFYIFAHSRTEDDGATKRLIWQPRLTKPAAQTNSMLFKAYPPSDKLKIIWMIPDKHLWSQYERGKVTESNIVMDSINNFLHKREELERSEPDDLSDAEVAAIYSQISKAATKNYN